MQDRLSIESTNAAQRREAVCNAAALPEIRYGPCTGFAKRELRKYIAGEKELDAVEKSILSFYTGKYAVQDAALPFWDNRLQICDTEVMRILNAAECTIGIMKLDAEPVKELDLGYYRDIHRRLYSSLYPWAGEIRDINITGHPEAVKHIPYPFTGAEDIWEELDTAFDGVRRAIDRNVIENALAAVFAELNVKNWKRMERREKIERLVEGVGDIWHIHPFLHGNILTELYFIIRGCAQIGLPCERAVFKEYGENHILLRSMVIAGYDPEPLTKMILLAAGKKEKENEKDTQTHKKNWNDIETIIKNRKEMERKKREGPKTDQEAKGS